MSTPPMNPAPQPDFTAEQMQLITRTVAPGATPDELKLFLYRCKTLGFDPLKPGMIHFVKYGSGPGTIVVGRDGFRTRASRSGKLNGIKCGSIRDDKGTIIGGWAEVYRTDWQHPARIEVSVSEYSTGRGPWQKMPETMIQKVAECAALRMAFPDDLGGVYSDAEMDQARDALPVVVPEQPAPEDGVQDLDTGYKIDFGKWNRRSIEEVYRNNGPKQIADYIAFLEESAKKKGVVLEGKAAKFIAEAERFLGAMENEPGSDG